MSLTVRSCLVAVIVLLSFSVSAQEITKKRGTVKIYYPNGKIKAKGKVKNYHKHGEWKHYNEQGDVIRVAHFVRDTVDGAYTEFYADGRISSAGIYCMNNKCGNWKGYDARGQLISDENFTGSLQDGTQRFWYPEGVLRDSFEFNRGIIQYHQSWFKSGQIKTIETYMNGLAEGRWKVYPEVRIDTFASTVDDYHLGKKHGWHYMWNGASLIEAYQYEDGLPDGMFARFEYDGDPLLVQSYVKGKLSGQTVYFKDRMKLREENYLNDLKQGEQIEYDRSGRVSKRSWYNHGDIDSSYSYHSNGRVAIRRVYGGMLGTTPYEEWDTAGVLIMRGMMYGELRDGEWTTYYPNGKVRSTTNYQQGKIIGLYTKYYPNGKKMIQYTFLPIGTNTMPDVWNEKGKILKIGSKEYDEIVEGNRPGEIINDPSEFNREIIDHRINEAQPAAKDFDLLEDPDQQVIGDEGVDVVEEPEFFLMDVDQALAIAEEDRLRSMNDSGEVYSFCEIMPKFPGGEAAMQKFILDSLRYPGDGNFKTVAYIEYIVEKDGTVTNVLALRDANDAFVKEAVRVVSLFPPHERAVMNGQYVRCKVVLPIRVNVQK